MKKRTFSKKFIRKEFILTKSISQEAEIVKGLKISKLDLSKMEKSKASFDNQDIWIDDSEKIKETITGIWRGKYIDIKGYTGSLILGFYPGKGDYWGNWVLKISSPEKAKKFEGVISEVEITPNGKLVITLSIIKGKIHLIEFMIIHSEIFKASPFATYCISGTTIVNKDYNLRGGITALWRSLGGR